MVAVARNRSVVSYDWVLVLLYSIMVFAGLANIYAATFSSQPFELESFSQSYVKQAVWIFTSYLIGIFILQIDSKFFSYFAYAIFGFMLVTLIVVVLFGKEVNGARSWFQLGPMRLQPAEFAKFATGLAVAKYLSTFGVSFRRYRTWVLSLSIILIPALLIITQNDTGSALVYASFFLIFYREGQTGFVLLIGVLLVVLSISVLLAPMELVFFSVLCVSIVVYLSLSKAPQNSIIGGLALIVFAFLFITFLVPPFGSEVTLKELEGTRYLFKDYLIIQKGSSSNGFVSFSFKKILFELGPNEIIEYVLLGILMIFLGLIVLIHAYKQKLVILYILILFALGAVVYSKSVVYIYDSILSDHHRTRIEVLLGKKDDPQGAGYNSNQSRIAISSGGWYGKGFLQGTRNKGNFVPEQNTDFIFCTVGEEWGFLGSTGLLALFVAFLWRLISVAERQRSAFSRIYGYAVAAVLFFHLTINIGMTIGLIPVIGIPLPFFSYGGSSLWAFTVLLFIFIRLDASRDEIL